MVYLFLVLGMLVYILIDMATFRKGLKDSTWGASAKTYIDLNGLYIVAGSILAYVLTEFTISGQMTFLEKIGFTFGIPVEAGGSAVSAFLFGMLNQWVLVKVRKFIKSPQYETTGGDIDTN